MANGGRPMPVPKPEVKKVLWGDKQTPYGTNTEVRAKISAIRSKIADIDEKNRLNTAQLVIVNKVTVNANNSASIEAEKSRIYARRESLNALRKIKMGELSILNSVINDTPGKKPSKDVKTGTGTGTGTNTATGSNKSLDGKPKVNLSATKENYFTTTSFLKDTLESDTNFPALYTPEGKAVNSTALKSADTLWTANKSSKGVIQTWNSSAAYTSSAELLSGSGATQKYNLEGDIRAFQFHYNPGSVSMVYRGVPDVDISVYTANIEKFNLMSPQTNMSTIQFSLVLNRMSDMHYITPSGDYRRPGVAYKGDVYSRDPRTTTKYNELKDIYEKGTMYDVEYLLNVLVGYQLNSALRKGSLTSDMGWVSPRPVELHLGSNLRYLIFISEFQIDHAIFNERMVPLLSTVKLSGTRIPDYDGSKVQKG
jgi:hypothetical protein